MSGAADTHLAVGRRMLDMGWTQEGVGSRRAGAGTRLRRAAVGRRRRRRQSSRAAAGRRSLLSTRVAAPP